MVILRLSVAALAADESIKNKLFESRTKTLPILKSLVGPFPHYSMWTLLADKGIIKAADGVTWTS